MSSSSEAAAQKMPETYREELYCLTWGQGLEGQLSHDGAAFSWQKSWLMALFPCWALPPPPQNQQVVAISECPSTLFTLPWWFPETLIAPPNFRAPPKPFPVVHAAVLANAANIPKTSQTCSIWPTYHLFLSRPKPNTSSSKPQFTVWPFQALPSLEQVAAFYVSLCSPCQVVPNKAQAMVELGLQLLGSPSWETPKPVNQWTIMKHLHTQHIQEADLPGNRALLSQSCSVGLVPAEHILCVRPILTADQLGVNPSHDMPTVIKPKLPEEGAHSSHRWAGTLCLWCLQDTYYIRPLYRIWET